MFSQLFGNYLVKENALTEEDLKDILAKQSEERVKLGVIAVAEKMLTEEQASEINQLQLQMDKRFGDIAVDKGYLTNEQVEELLSKQGSPYMKFLQLLLEKGSVPVAKVDGYLESFQKENGFDDSEMEALKKDEIDAIVPIYAFASKPYVTSIVGLVLRNITRFVSLDYYIGHIKQVNQLEYRCFAGQKCVGDHSICIGFATTGDDDTFVDIASGFTGEGFGSNGVEVYDAVGEFVNCINGLFATAVSEKNIELEIEPQFAYENQVAQGSAYVLPIYIGGKEIKLYIAVDSEVTIGSMPIVRKMRVAEGTEDSDSKGRIVIVDDSGMSRKMLRNILEEAGYSVVGEAADGMEGVLAYKQFNPDVITLDITMPVMSGTDALKEIKDYDSDAKAVMITAAGQQNKVIEALKLGAEKFVTKPFDKEEILKSISEILA